MYRSDHRPLRPCQHKFLQLGGRYARGGHQHLRYGRLCLVWHKQLDYLLVLSILVCITEVWAGATRPSVVMNVSYSSRAGWLSGKLRLVNIWYSSSSWRLSIAEKPIRPNMSRTLDNSWLIGWILPFSALSNFGFLAVLLSNGAVTSIAANITHADYYYAKLP